MDPKKCHPGWTAAGMVAMLVTVLVITGGLLFALKGATQAIDLQRQCPPRDRPRDDDKSLPAILWRMRELGRPPPRVESWMTVFSVCAQAMVAVSVALTMVVVLWLKKACTRARVIPRMGRRLGCVSEEPPTVPHNSLLPDDPASPGAVDQA
ncbi:unnamed protein product [Arctogadus glacialis]